MVEKLKKEIQALPIGYRYTGRFYLRKPYSNPIEYEEINGSLFMREDLETWLVEGEAHENRGRCRIAYKNPHETGQIEKKDATPVFEPIKEQAEIEML